MSPHLRPNPLALAVALFAASAAQAGSILPASFGPTAVVEDFEGLTARYNVGHPEQNAFIPGIFGPYTFGSGLTLVAPTPNSDDRVAVYDHGVSRVRGAGWMGFGLGSNGSVNEAIDVPFGTAFLADGRGPAAAPLAFDLPTASRRVGAYVTAESGSIVLSAFGLDGRLISSASIDAVRVSRWGDNFVSVEADSGISRITLTGRWLVLDRVAFEPVPEPSTLLTWGLAIAGALAAWRRRRLPGR